MKAGIFLLLLGAASASSLSPVTRVVELLKGLAATIEKEGKAEEDLFESYVCWGKSVIAQKTASNSEAASRIDTLETYIADLDSGRIELTSERSDVEKDIAELSADLEQAKALREKENADFKDAKAEMTQAVTGLKSAMDVLGEATKDNKEGVLLAVHSRLNHGMEALAQQQLNLKHAVKLGERFLNKADANFLRRLLSGEVPRADAKKLNRKATFKMAYKARSFKIQDVLKKMHSTFTANLDEATQSEADAKAAYDTLAKSKGDQLTAAQDALSKGEVENGARGKSKSDSEDELNGLKKQVTNDSRFIAETTAALAKKKGDWKVRSDLRAGELAAMSKAIYILHNDDARDLMKKSFSSQEGFFFLQTSSSSAVDALRNAARKSGDARLLTLAKLVAGPKDKFGKIVASIDVMIGTLKSEAASDLKIKEDCEKGRMEDTRTAALASRAIDDFTDAMTKLNSEIKQLEKDIVAMEEKKTKVKEELATATDLRKKENTEWTSSNSDDEQAAITVNNAKDVLEGFYKDNNLAFVQAPVVEAGEAPPPPPATFEGDYGGKTGESQGISAILGMVYEDIKKDQKKAKADEEESQAAFDKFEKSSNDEVGDIGAAISKAKGLIGDKEQSEGSNTDERGIKKGELNAVLKKMEGINPNCEYFSVNYKMRADNRDVEVDGLVKAKAILQGGTFAKAPDPNREMKPGDAFLQRRA